MTEQRDDGWINLATGIGIQGRDKAVANYMLEPKQWGQHQLDNIYRGSGIARRIVDVPADDVVREWFDVHIKATDPKAASNVVSGLHAELRRLRAKSAIKKAKRFDLRYGGGAVIIVADDGRDPKQPMGKPRRILKLQPVHRFQLERGEIVTDPQSVFFNKPGSYRLSLPNSERQEIHASRVLTFVSFENTLEQSDFDGWGDSIYIGTYDALADYEIGMRATTGLLYDFAQPVFGIPGLRGMLAAGREDTVRRRFAIQDYVRGNTNLMMLDSEVGETFERVTTNIGGVGDLLDRAAMRLAGHTGMPLTKIFGLPPKGFATEDKSGQDNWNNRVAADQEENLLPELERLIDTIFDSTDGPTGGIRPESYEIEFLPLTSDDPIEQATLEKTYAERDAIYIDRGVVTVEEVALSRFTAEGFQSDTTINPETRNVSTPPIPFKPGEAQADPAAAQPVGDPLEGQDIESAAPSTDPPPEDLVSPQQAAQQFGVATRTITLLIDRGELRYWGLGRHKRVSLADVATMAKSHEKPDEPEDPDGELQEDASLWGTYPAERDDKLNITSRERAIDPGPPVRKSVRRGNKNGKKTPPKKTGYFKWMTRDSKARPSHLRLHGRVFSWAEGGPGGVYPGQPPNCRCYAKDVKGPGKK